MEGHNDTSLALEALSATIDQETAHFVLGARLVKRVYHRVNPAASLDIVKTSNDHLELAEEIFLELLHRLGVPIDVDPGAAALHKLSSHFGLELADIVLAEEELAVEVGEIDFVQVDHVNVLDARHGEILQDLAAKTSSADHKNARLRVLNCLK